MRHPYDGLRTIATPLEGIPHCVSRAAYAEMHLRELRAKQQAYPHLDFREPWLAEPGAQPFVVGGKWVVLCRCEDAPMASPEWDEARCFQCGAIYRALQWPRDRAAIEAVLCARPQAALRTWLPTETVGDLRRQNGEHGVPEVLA